MGGVVDIEPIIFAPCIGVHYTIEISDALLISESFNYWRQGYTKTEGLKTNSGYFSCASLSESSLLRLTLCDTEFNFGPGIGFYLLKNRVKEKTHSGDWVITKYYCLTSSAVGFHIDGGISSKIRKMPIGAIVRGSIILMNIGEENLFYTNGDIRVITGLLSFYF